MTVWREKNTNAKFNFQLLLTESCYMTSNLIQAFAFGIWQSLQLGTEENIIKILPLRASYLQVPRRSGLPSSFKAIPQVNKGVSVLESMPVNECLVMWYHDANGWDWDASTKQTRPSPNICCRASQLLDLENLSSKEETWTKYFIRRIQNKASKVSRQLKSLISPYLILIPPPKS